MAEEEFIFDLYAGEIEQIEKDMEQVRNVISLGLAGDDGTRRELEAEMVHLQEGLDDTCADRRGMLMRFRKSQGIWGDG